MEIPNQHKENLEIWQNDPFTRWYLEQIDLERQEVQRQMGMGCTVDVENVDFTAQQTAKHFGLVSGYDFCTEFEIERGEE